MGDDTDLELGNEMPIEMQFNGGRCYNCDAILRESPYVGGDHDPIAECPDCGKHFGCWVCKERA